MIDVYWFVFGFMITLASFVGIFIYAAKKTKNNTLYLYSGVCSSLIFVLLAIVLDQYLLVFIFAGVSAILAIACIFKFMQSPPPNPIIANLETLDTSGPLKLRDVFTLNFIFKLEKTYGKYKAMVIYATVYAGLISLCFILPLCLISGVPLLMVGVGFVMLFVFLCLSYLRIREGKMPGRYGWLLTP
jgi:hypothetical protein